MRRDRAPGCGPAARLRFGPWVRAALGGAAVAGAAVVFAIAPPGTGHAQNAQNTQNTEDAQNAQTTQTTQDTQNTQNTQNTEDAQSPGPQRLTLETPYAPPGYERLLKNYVVQTPRGDGGFTTRVDYAALRDARDGEAVRKTLRERFLAVDPEAMDPVARIAWALNAYNFLVIDLVVKNLTAPSGAPLASIGDIGPKSFAVFDLQTITLGEETYSLNRFERHFLFLDVDRNAKTAHEELDPRLHFALVCAAVGCPPLWPRPFLPEQLDEQLDAAVRNALLSDRHLRVDGHTVHVSRIFDWYAADFGRKDGIRAFLMRYAPPAAVKVLGGKQSEVAPDIEWDWSLNRPLEKRP